MAGHHRNPPTRIDRSAVGGLLAIDGEADADAATVRLSARLAGPNGVEIDGREGAPQRFRIVAAIEMLPGDILERHLVRPDQVLQPDLVGLDTGFARDGIE